MPISRSTSLPSSRARTKIVWCALAGAMTVGVGLLSLLDSGSPTRSSGVTLSPLMAVGGARGVEAVFQTRAPIEEDRWHTIVLVHSGSPAGSAATIEESHRAVGYDGLGFHFVVGNGAGMSDGQIHVGYRWLDQLDGAELAGLSGSSRGIIEVCLVGDGDRRPFGREQLVRTAQLVNALADRLGISPDRIRLHQDLAQTSSPGRYFPRQAFEELLASMR
ncbi:MAG: peptidoglycan recognition protein family protein [Phycisphaerales bacterium]|nr:N-acetylmuramoyl-L-alanine amidase [Planctomycetota bacterium]MCH8509663.1 peptidoglycan recognition protein family protein [Phycisphaerales bacterium]